MANIMVLDQNTINQIAAGEVVERPASIVKELLENAIDAKATAITVEIKDGGISFIRITDNGCGIEKEDIPVAFLRHSTSKIKTAVDLLNISSLGFRGEALSSIAAVAMVELITKSESSFCGTRYVIEGGEEKSFEDIGVPNGTTFIVRNLFYNTPARRKFLKSSNTEASYISDIVEKIALSHPEISIRFICNNQNKLHTSGNGSLKDVIYTVYNREIATNLVEINKECDFMKITGFVGKPSISRGNRGYENYFINGRYVKSNFIYRAIEDAYKSFMMQHKYPFTCINISVNTELLDVNVHPSKMELRFRNQDEIYPFVFNAIDNALHHRELIPSVKLQEDKQVKEKTSTNIVSELLASNGEKVRIPEPFETTRNRDLENKLNSITGNIQKEEVSKAAVLKEDRSEYSVNDNNRVTTINYSKSNIIVDNNTDSATENSNSDISNGDILNINKTGSNTESNDTGNSNIVGSNAESNDTTNSNIVGSNTESNDTVDSNIVDSDKTSSNTAGNNTLNRDILNSGIANDVNEDIKKISEKTQIKNEQMELFDDVLLSKKARISHKIVGQVFDTYWIVEYGDKMFIIDQHAAHEKVLYERIVERYNKKETLSQEINPPIVISLNMKEEQVLKINIDSFKEFGYEIEEFGGNEYAIRAVPYDLLSLSDKDLFLELLDGINIEDSVKVKPDMLIDRMATMACKAAVKGNNKLSLEEANELIDELLTLDNPYNCPHGRPTIISMTKYEMEKKFKRII